MEDLLIRKVKGGIKNGTKDATEIEPLLNKLRALNEGMYDELAQEYKIALEKRKN